MHAFIITIHSLELIQREKDTSLANINFLITKDSFRTMYFESFLQGSKFLIPDSFEKYNKSQCHHVRVDFGSLHITKHCTYAHPILIIKIKLDNYSNIN